MKKDTFIDGSTPAEDADLVPEGHSNFSWGMELALAKAGKVKSLGSVFGEGVRNAIDMVFGVLPVVMGLGTIALVIAEYTSVFSFLGQPFYSIFRVTRSSRSCCRFRDYCCRLC